MFDYNTLPNNFVTGSSTTHASGFPIACRVVPYDQWLVTHVDTTWKVKDIKHWIMSKCNAWGSTAAPQPPRFRPSSPVIFSGPSRRSSIDSSSFGGTEEGDGEDEWDVFAALEYNPDNHVSEIALEKAAQATTFYPSNYTTQRPTPLSPQDYEQAATSAKYTLVSFSGGYILEDDLDLAWYKPNPFELLEMHRAGAIVSLPRNGIAYIEPYFESAVQVSDRPHGNRRVSRTPGHKTHMSTPSEDFDYSQDRGQSSTVIEWKSRWAIVREGFLHLCKECHTAPTHRFPIAALCALGGPEHFGLPAKSTSRIICAKFRHVSSKDNMSTVGEQDTDEEATPSVSSKIQPPRRQKQKPKSSSWVILEMPNRSSYEALLRVLHRLAPHPLTSTFLPPRTPAPSPVSPSSPHQPPFSGELPSPTQEASSASAEFFGVQYPEWRMALLARARQAGRGNIGPALTLAHTNNILSSPESVRYQEHNGAYSLSVFHHLPRAPSISEGLRRWATNTDSPNRVDKDDEIYSSEREEEGISNIGHSDGWNQEAWKDAVSDVERDEEDDAESEVEWDGWVRDLARRALRPKLTSILNRPQSPNYVGGILSSGPGSPSSSDYEHSYGQSTSLLSGRGGTIRSRTVSSYSPIHSPQTTSPRLEPLGLSRSRARTLGAFSKGNGFIPYTYSTTTITTYVDRVPDSCIPSSGSSFTLGNRTTLDASLPLASSSTSDLSPISTPRAARRIPSQPNAMNLQPMIPHSSSSRTLALSGNISESGSEHSSLASTFNSSGNNVESSGSGSVSGKSKSTGGVRRIVRGVSIRNAFSTERLVRGLEDALDFVDGR